MENDIIYFDCFSGASGDMIIGALLDAGASIDSLVQKIKNLNISGYNIDLARKISHGISASKFIVQIEDGQPERNFNDIKDILINNNLSEFVKENSIKTFKLLAEAEAKVHGKEAEKIHFHEIGAVDSIIDIVGTFIALENLNKPCCFSSPLPISYGEVKTAHGILPLPAPATTEILQNIPVRSAPHLFEYVTPTGAAILKTICKNFKSFPSMKIKKVGYGAGDKELQDRPNILRVFLGEENEMQNHEEILVEVNLDNMNPETYPFVINRLFEAGSLDVWLTPVIMKKGRPGNMISIIAPDESFDKIASVLFNETSTIGLRFNRIQRLKLPYKIENFNSSIGECRIKIASFKKKTTHIAPEYEDCAIIAEKTGISLIEVRRKILEEYLSRARL